MKLNAPPLPASQSVVERRLVVLGFSAVERHQLETVFRLAAARPLRYRLVASAAEAELAVADADQPEVMAELHRHGLVAVLVGDSQGATASRLARPLNVGQVLRSLDQLVRRGLAIAAPSRRVLDELAQAAGRPPVQPRASLLLVAGEQAATPLQMAPVQRAGVEVTRVRSGAEAIERTRSTRFDLVLIEATLDGLDGYHACRTIKQRAARLSVLAPSIHLLVPSPFDVARVRAELAGADGLLQAPLDSAELLALLPLPLPH